MSAESPTRPDQPAAGQMRASDAERDAVLARLRDGFAAGRLSQDTFLYRMHAVLRTRRQTELPALLADLPDAAPEHGGPGTPGRPGRPGPPAALIGRLRAAWPRRAATGAPAWCPGRPPPLEFPRGTGDSFSIGRAGDCDLTVFHPTVSRKHATLERTADGWLLTDLSSTNGTRVNGWRVRGQVRVRAGDVVSFGDAGFTLRAADGR